MNYWLLKSEPDSFSYDDLASAPGGRTIWDGVRNYQARNILRDDVAQGDLAFFTTHPAGNRQSPVSAG